MGAKSTLVSLGLLFFPQLAQACAVCFGKTDNLNIAKAYTWGIVILLAFTALIIAALIVAIIRIEKRQIARAKEL